MQVRNKHVSTVGGIPPGEFGDADQETVDRYPWALIPLAPPAPPEDQSARSARAAIRDSSDVRFVRGFLNDDRSSVRADAERRIKALEK